MRYVRLHGPNGIFSFCRPHSTAQHFVDLIELPLIALINVREFRITDFDYVAYPLPSLPALETLATQSDKGVSDILSALLSNPASSPSLNTIAFLNCSLSEDFMEKLTQFAYNRKNTSNSAWLDRVLIVHWKGQFPSADSIRRLRSRVTIVDVRMDGGRDFADSHIKRYLAG